ncbi:MAG: hypothetical protein U9Q20_05110 [Campylobacterota bacterium]|nr:hypothetical protein [Campylobacterota bacterium]
MKLNKIYKVVICFSLIVTLISGCSTAGINDENNETLSATSSINNIKNIEVFLINNNLAVDTNEQSTQIIIGVVEQDTNAPYNLGIVKVEYPDAIKTKDIGFFSSSATDVVDGKAVFIFTAPSDLTSVENESHQFKFYHEDNPLQKTTLTIVFKPKEDQIVNTTYAIEYVSDDEKTTMPIEDTKIFTMNLKDENGNLVEDYDIFDINITTLNSGIIDIIENSTADIVSYVNDNSNSVSTTLNSNKLSGLTPIEVSVSFEDLNGNKQIIKKIFNIVVLSGPPTTISYSYIAGEHNNTKGKLIDKIVISVSDKYFNPINTNPSISVGAIVGYTDNGLGEKLYYNTTDLEAGTLKANNTFSAGSDLFSLADEANDIFVTFGNGYTYNASGKWDFTKINDSNLNLLDNYTSDDVSSLGFAMGHNYRQDQCLDGIEWTGSVKSSDNKYVIDSTGTAIVDIEYDYYLIGKDIVLWTNIVGDNKKTDQTVRIGEAQKITLRGLGIKEESNTFACGFEGQHTFWLDIEDTQEPYRNANFNIDAIASAGDVVATYSYSSIDDGIDSCNISDGRAYVTLDINTSVGNCKGGTVTLKTSVKKEF